MILALSVVVACHRPSQADGVPGGGQESVSAGDSAVADACPGAPTAQIYWYPRAGDAILEVQVDEPAPDGNGYALGMTSADWTGEACGDRLDAQATCALFDQTIALQTVDSSADVVIGSTTWFTQARFGAWALYYGQVSHGMDTGTGRWADCVGSGYPDCCTRDSPAAP